jgi:hypothetical protein
MPEEIRPSRSIESGRVDTGRPGTSGLASLGQALRTVSNTVGDLTERAAEKELREMEDLLSSPLLSENEIQEIEESATFPLGRIKARNRRGSFLAQQAYDNVFDQVSQAPDATSARKILREAQQGILGQSDDASVQAGIRERFSEFGTELLSEAAQRRVVARAREETINVAEDQRVALESGSRLNFGNVLVGQLEDEQIANGDVAALVDTSILSLEAYWLAGDDDEIGKGNVHANRTLDHIDLILDEVPMESSERLKFSRLRERIEAGEEAAIANPEKLQTDALKRAHKNHGAALTNWSLDNPGVIPPEALTRPYLATAPTESARRAALEFVQGVPDSGQVVGVTGTKQNTQTRGILLRRLAAFDAELSPEDAEAISFYDTLVSELDPDLRSDEAELRRQLDDIASLAVARTSEGRDEMRIREAEAQGAVQRETARLIRDADIGRPLTADEIKTVSNRVKEIRRPLVRAQRQADIESAAKELGIPLSSILNTSKR